VTKVEVTEAGVDTWSPSYYVDPDGACARWFHERATMPSARGSMLLPEKIAGHRVGIFPALGLVFAEGHPDPAGGLCPGGELVGRALDLQESLLAAGIPLPLRERPFDTLGPTSEGLGGLRRADFTVNLEMPSEAHGLAFLGGVAAVARQSPGKAEVFFDRQIETVYFRGYAGRKVLGRWYDKGAESLVASRGHLIRGEDQRRWAKGDRRDPSELTGDMLRRSFQRRFYPLYKASKGVTVGGPYVVVKRIQEAVDAGELGRKQARALIGDTFIEAIGAESSFLEGRTLRRSRQLRRELGAVLADGVIENVAVDVAAVLEQAMESELWDRRG